MLLILLQCHFLLWQPSSLHKCNITCQHPKSFLQTIHTKLHHGNVIPWYYLPLPAGQQWGHSTNSSKLLFKEYKEVFIWSPKSQCTSLMSDGIFGKQSQPTEISSYNLQGPRGSTTNILWPDPPGHHKIFFLKTPIGQSTVGSISTCLILNIMFWLLITYWHSVANKKPVGIIRTDQSNKLWLFL